MKNLQNKILIPLVILLFISNITIFFGSLHGLKKSLYEQIALDIEHSSKVAASAIDYSNQVEWKGLNTLATNPLVTNPNADMVEKAKSIYEVLKRGGNYVDIFIMNPNGDSWVKGGKILVNFKERDYFQKPLENGKNFVGDPFINKVDGKRNIFYSVPVQDASGKSFNVISCVVDGYKFCSVCETNTIGKKSHPYIISRKTGKLIGSSDRKLLDEEFNFPNFVQEKVANGKSKNLKEMCDELMAGKVGSYNVVIDGKKYFGFFEPIPNTEWSSYSLVPYEDFDSQIHFVRNLLIVVFIIFSALLLGVVGRITRASIKPLKYVSKSFIEISNGNADLTKRLSTKSKDEVGLVVNGFNKFIELIQSIINKIMNSRDLLSAAGGQLIHITDTSNMSINRIAKNIENVNDKISNQQESVEMTSNAVNEIASNITSLDNLIQNQSQSVIYANNAIEQMIKNIESVNNSVNEMAESFTQLKSDAKNGVSIQIDVNEKIRQIENQSVMLQEANAVISQIAEQTNLLAMNAAIEAAHAGEAGKGFSVVADEIRKLSETSTMQSKTIGEQLIKIKSSIESVVSASVESSNAFSSVNAKIENTDSLVLKIQNAMEEQQANSVQISDSLHSVKDSAEKVSNASENMTNKNQVILSAMKNLKSVTNEISSSVDDMSSSVIELQNNGQSLNSVSDSLTDSINQISREINQFNV